MSIASLLLAEVLPALPPRAVPTVQRLANLLSHADYVYIRAASVSNLTLASNLMVGERGIGIAGTSLFVPFTNTFELAAAPAQVAPTIDEPSDEAFSFVFGNDRTFGMIANDLGRAHCFMENAARHALSNLCEWARSADQDIECGHTPATAQYLRPDDIICSNDHFAIPPIGIEAEWTDVTGCVADDITSLSYARDQKLFFRAAT